MKYFTRVGVCVIVLCCCTVILHAQTHPIDRFLNGSSIPTIIAKSSDKVLNPQDLDFCNIPSRKNELWVLNYGTSNGGTMVIIYDAGKPTQKSEYRKDSHSSHFMLNPTAFAMDDAGWFTTIGEGDRSDHFMGPVLWDNDTSVFARANQNNWVNGQLLGSHSDMLHESPLSMGIAHDTENVYWVSDGYHKCLYRYDFQVPHGYGEDDHSDGIVKEYPEVKLKRIAGLPSHMILDKVSGWLYIVDNGNKRIVRVNTRSGEEGDALTPVHGEPLQNYTEVINVQWETIDSGFTNLSGIDYFNGRLIVGNNGSGVIRVYNTTTPKPTYLGSIATGDPGMVGVKIGPDSNIWYVNKTDNTVIRLAPDSKPAIVTLTSPLKASTAVAVPTPLSWKQASGATSYHLQVATASNFAEMFVDSANITTLSATILGQQNSTTYYWRVKAKNADGESQWSETWNFKTVGSTPTTPVLLTPTNSAGAISIDTALTWEPLQNVTTYNLQVALTPNFMPAMIDKSDIATPKFDLPKLSNDTKYYWRIRGLNDGATGDWSDTWTFTTESLVSVGEEVAMDSKITIDDIYPNPSSSHSTVNFTLSEPMSLCISIINALGEEAKLLSDRFYDAGKQSLTFQSDLASGRYFYRFATRFGELVKPFVIQK